MRCRQWCPDREQGKPRDSSQCKCEGKAGAQPAGCPMPSLPALPEQKDGQLFLLAQHQEQSGSFKELTIKLDAFFQTSPTQNALQKGPAGSLHLPSAGRVRFISVLSNSSQLSSSALQQEVLAAAEIPFSAWLHHFCAKHRHHIREVCETTRDKVKVNSAGLRMC